MAVFGPIPLQAGFTSMGELADLMMNKRKMEQERYIQEMQNAQRAKEAAETAKYHQGMLGVSQGAAARQEKLLPFQMQKAQSDLAKSQMEQNFFKDLMSGNGSPDMASAGMNQPGMGGGSAQSPEMGGGGPPGAAQMEQQPPQMPTLENLQQGQSMMTRPAQDPRKANWDRFAGMTIGGIKIPDVSRRVDNGIEYTTYPSGKTVATKIGPSDVEKEEIKINAKASTDIRKSARDLKAMHDRALKLKKMIEDDPNLTGIIQGGKAQFNLSNDPKLAEFIQTSRKLQADMARYGSQRGGAQALKWAERAKPGEFRSGKFNLGMINSILEDSQSDYENLNSEYMDMNQRPLHIKLTPAEKKEEGVIELNGKKYKQENGEWHEIGGSA